MFRQGGGTLLAGAVLLLAGATVLLALSLSARADEATTNAAIARLLDVGWSPSSQARAAADSQSQIALQSAAGDPRALAAVWLVLMQQRRFEEALKRVDEHLAADPDDLLALRAKTWLHTILKSYSGAMLTAETLSDALADRPVDTEEGREEFDSTVGFLGRLLGFLGGPAAEAVSQDARKALEKKIVARLDAPRQAVFEEARNGVLTRHIELTDESADSRDQAAAAQQAEKQKTLAELEADRAKIDKQMQEIAERREKIRDELRSELDDIAAKDQPLTRELARLSSRSSLLSADLINYSAQMTRLQQLAATEKGRGRQQQLLFEADSLAIITSRLEADLESVNRQARLLQQQRAALAARQAQAQSDAASQIKRLDRESADLAKRDRRNDGIEKRTARPASVSSSKSRSLIAQASALSTYDAFPLEAAKARLLDSLR